MILITGATGHIGNVLSRVLCARGEQVRILALPDDDCASIADLDVECVVGNVLDPDSLIRAMSGVDLVYHLAGIISIMPDRAALMRQVNVEGAHNVAQAARHAGVRRLVHVSSIHAFQSMPQGTVVDETTPLAINAPPHSYNRTKAEGTARVLLAVEQGLDAVIACPTGVIGPYDYLHSEMGTLIQNFARRKMHMLIDGAYDFVDVRDVVDGLLRTATHGRMGELYILSGFNIPLTHLRRIIQDLTGIHTPSMIVPFGLAKAAAKVLERFYRWTGHIPLFTTYSLKTVHENVFFSHDKASRTFDYQPRPLRRTLEDLLVWHKQPRLAARAFQKAATF
jgi:dihydroflavonol-4-reductase